MLGKKYHSYDQNQNILGPLSHALHLLTTPTFICQDPLTPKLPEVYHTLNVLSSNFSGFPSDYCVASREVPLHAIRWGRHLSFFGGPKPGALNLPVLALWPLSLRVVDISLLYITERSSFSYPSPPFPFRPLCISAPLLNKIKKKK